MLSGRVSFTGSYRRGRGGSAVDVILSATIFVCFGGAIAVPGDRKECKAGAFLELIAAFQDHSWLEVEFACKQPQEQIRGRTLFIAIECHVCHVLGSAKVRGSG